MISKLLKRLKKQVKEDNERGAREAVLEDLFNDFNKSRYTIYKFNFVRGVFFGLGSVLGGTVVLAVLVWLLNLTGNLIPGVADFIHQVVDVVHEVGHGGARRRRELLRISAADTFNLLDLRATQR